MCSANTIEKTRARSSKPLWNTENDRLSAFEQRIWCDRRQLDAGTPTSFQYLFSMVCTKHFARDDPVFQFWRATAHKSDKSEEPSWITMYLTSVLICWSDFAGNTTTYSRKPASHVRSTELHFAFKWPHVLILSLKYHPYQTPSLCPFRADAVVLQIQVLQSRVLSEAFGQGLTGESWWTSSPALLIKLWVISFLPSFSRISAAIEPMDGFGMQSVSFNIMFAHICSLTALERGLPKTNLNPSPSQSDHHKTTSEESQCIYRLATLRSTKIHFAMLSFQSPWTFHWLHFQVTVSWSFLYALSLPTILTKHQAFAPSGPMLLLSKFRFFRVEFSLRHSAKAWQEKSGLWVQLLNWSNSESSQSSLLAQPRDEGWSIRSIKHQTLLNTGWWCGHVNSHFFVIATHSNLYRYEASRTHQLALTMKSTIVL